MIHLLNSQSHPRRNRKLEMTSSVTILHLWPNLNAHYAQMNINFLSSRETQGECDYACLRGPLTLFGCRSKRKLPDQPSGLSKQAKKKAQSHMLRMHPCHEQTSPVPYPPVSHPQDESSKWSVLQCNVKSPMCIHANSFSQLGFNSVRNLSKQCCEWHTSPTRW